MEPETAYCNKCSSYRPIDRFGVTKQGGLKPQCKDCRNAYAKTTTKWKRQCLEAAARGEEMPPEPTLSVPCKPVGGLNDTTCPECGIKIKRQNLALHMDCVHKEGGHVCDQCGFVSDCFGLHMKHMELAHSVTVKRPIKMKDLYMCAMHKTVNKKDYASKYFKTPEQREKDRIRRANAPAASKVYKRKTNYARDHSEAHMQYLRNNPHIKSAPSAGYEGQPLRKFQKRFQEKSVSTRSMRLEWRVHNHVKVRDILRKSHVANRRARNEAARVYAAGNTRLKWQQVKDGAMRRGLDFSLSETFVDRLARMPCFYCNTPADQASVKGLCGIDRVDNDGPYSEANCVPCCGACNVMKNTLSVEAYLSHLEKIFRHLSLERPLNGDEEAFEDTVAGWNAGVNDDILDNVEFMKFVVNTALPTSYMSNHLSRNCVKAFVHSVTDTDISELPPGEFDAQSELGMVVAPEQLQKTRDLMAQEVYTLFADMMEKKAVVEYVGKHEWRLKDEEVVAMMFKSMCTYCGFAGNLGIDRLDSSGAYEVGNVVPCCHTCNITKNVFYVDKFLCRVHDTVTTLSLDSTKDVVRGMTARARELQLDQFVCTRRHGDRQSHFDISAGVTTSTTRCMRRVTDVAVVYKFADKRKEIVYHSRECGGMPLDRCRLVTMDRLASLAGAIKACPKCVTDSALMPDATPLLKDTAIPWLREGEGLSVARRHCKGAMRVGDWALTDIVSGFYHSLKHTASDQPVAVVRLEHALSLNPKLKACSKCVSTNEEDPLFELSMVAGCDRCDTLEQCSAFHQLAKERLREYNMLKKRESAGGVIDKKVPGETVLLFKNPKAKVYHTQVHRIRGLPGEGDEALWLEVPLSGQRFSKPCRMCCL